MDMPMSVRQSSTSGRPLVQSLQKNMTHIYKDICPHLARLGQRPMHLAGSPKLTSGGASLSHLEQGFSAQHRRPVA